MATMETWEFITCFLLLPPPPAPFYSLPSSPLPPSTPSPPFIHFFPSFLIPPLRP